MTSTTTTRPASGSQAPTGGVVDLLPDTDQCRRAKTHTSDVGSGTLDQHPTKERATPKRHASGAGQSSTDTDHRGRETQLWIVGSVDPSPSTPPSPSSGPNRVPVGWAAFDQLGVYAECLADTMQHRIAVQNRLRSGTVPEDVVAEILADLDHTEKLLRKGMVAAFRTAAPEVAAWTRDTVGLGESTMARLLGVIGHPVVARPHHWEGEGANRTLVADEPFLRSVSQLWSYCGHGDPARRKRKGMTADDAMALGSPRAKTLVFMLAESCMKAKGSQPIHAAQPTGASAENGTDDARSCTEPGERARRRSPYRDTYDNRRQVTADRDWTDGHRHADALRITGKTILRDLWVVAREAMEDQ